MTGSPSPQGSSSLVAPSAQGTTGEQRRSVRILLFSDDRATRDVVRLAVGRRPARDVEVASWLECATAPAVTAAVKARDADLLILDGEAAPLGGMGLCRQLKYEVYDCPPVILLTGRPQDGWLAAWSYADHAVPHPVDALSMCNAVAEVARTLPGFDR